MEVTVYFFRHLVLGEPDPVGTATWDGHRISWSGVPADVRHRTIRGTDGRPLTPADGERYVRALPLYYTGTYFWAEEEPPDEPGTAPAARAAGA